MAGDPQAADPGYQIALATRADIGAILDLQERNSRERGGTLAVCFSRDWFEAALADLPLIVTRKAGGVVGYLVSSSQAAQGHVPIVRAMLAAYPGAPGAYVYGPVCVAPSERGRGLAGEMLSALRGRLAGREGITFIRKDNVASLRAHAKIELREVAEFDEGGTAFVVIAHAG